MRPGGCASGYTVAVFLAATVTSTPARAAAQESPAPQGATAVTPAEVARAELAQPHATAAGVAFMSGMIPHHAQAIVMSRMAASHGASTAVRDLSDRIAVSQRDEIAFMRRWLSDRGQIAPQADTIGLGMAGMGHSQLMPGMLDHTQLDALDRARGAAFDQAYLIDMIAHHRGAIQMANQLLAGGDASDKPVSIYAAAVAADQSAEIDRMQRMLLTVAGGSAGSHH